MFERLIDLIGGLDLVGLVAVAAALALGETAIGLDLVVPGEVGMVLVGAATSDGEHAVLPVVVAAAVGATCGDTVSYAVGRRWGPSLVRRFGSKERSSSSLARAERWFDRYGPAAVFGGRWVGALRAVVPVVAGAARMPFGQFLRWNSAASACWATVVVLVGVHLGVPAARWLDRVGWWTYPIVAALALVVWLERRRRRATKPTRVGDSRGPRR